MSMNAFMQKIFVCLIIGLMGSSTYGEVVIRVAGLENVVPAGYARVDSHGEEVNELSINMGDPLGLRIVLENHSNEETKKMAVSLNPRWIPARVIVVHPDDRESRSPLTDLRVRAFVTPRTMKPHERIEASLYAYTDEAAETDGKTEYLFPEPGQYTVYVDYHTEAGLPRDTSAYGTIRSNPIRVTVGPPFPGWDELRNAGLVGAVRTGTFVSLQPEFNKDWRVHMEKLGGLIVQADRPWLTAWYAKQKAAALEAAATLENHSSPPPGSSQDEDPAAAQGGGS